MKLPLLFLPLFLLTVSCERQQEAAAPAPAAVTPVAEDPRLNYRRLADATFKTGQLLFTAAGKCRILEHGRKFDKPKDAGILEWNTAWREKNAGEYYDLTQDATTGLAEVMLHAETLRNLPTPPPELAEIHSLTVDMNLALGEIAALVTLDRSTETIFVRGDKRDMDYPGSRLVKAHERLDLLLPR